MSVAPPVVAVVLATHNRRERLERLLDALSRQTLPTSEFEVFVVDDGSTDGTGELLADAAERWPELRLYSLHHPVAEGPASARNDGWRAASAATIAFTDDDCEPAPEWLSEGLRACELHPGAVVSGQVGPIPAEADILSPFTRTVRVDGDGPYYQACNIFYPRALLDRLGGFDSDSYRAVGGEDTDLAWRAIEAGAETAFAGQALVHHAVIPLGARGRLRIAARWGEGLHVYQRHPAAKARVFTRGVFWKPWHYTLVRALVALLLPRRLRHLRVFLVAPYLDSLLVRRRYEHGRIWHTPFYVVEDVVEISAALRASVRHRMIVI